MFEEELVGLRFSKTEHILVPLMTDEQLKAVDGAIESPDVADGAKAHLSNALKMLRDGNPADVIRECLHAVEAQVRSVSGLPKATLSQGLAVIKKTRKLHPAFEQGLDKLYAYAGDEQGIRHAGDGKDSPANRDDALFFVIACSAFVSWLQAHTTVA